MLRGALASLAFAAALLEPAFIGAAQTPDAGKQTAPAAPAPTQPQPPTVPAPAAPQPPAPGAAPEAPAAPAEQPPGAAPSPGAVELPPIKIIQTQPEPPKPAKKAAPAPRRAAPRIAAPAARPQRPAPAAPAAPEAPAAPAAAQAETAEQTVAMTPVKGSEIPLDKVPGSVSLVSSADIQSSGSPALQDALQQYVPGAIVSDVTGNPFSVDVQYRGFTASPVEGTPQGLAVYQNGVRINEVFGDTVNWDLIPSNAINGVTVVSGNPLYGLNALGGALNIGMKDGFSYQGVESDTRAGSWGRFQEAIQAGKQVDNFAAYVAVEGIHDGGWRELSPSDVKRAYIDLGARGQGYRVSHQLYRRANPAWRGRPNAGRAGRTELRRRLHQSADHRKSARDVLGERQREAFRYVDRFRRNLLAQLPSEPRGREPFQRRALQSAQRRRRKSSARRSYDTTSLLCLQTVDGSIVPVTDRPASRFSPASTAPAPRLAKSTTPPTTRPATARLYRRRTRTSSSASTTFSSRARASTTAMSSPRASRSLARSTRKRSRSRAMESS